MRGISSGTVFVYILATILMSFTSPMSPQAHAQEQNSPQLAYSTIPREDTAPQDFDTQQQNIQQASLGGFDVEGPQNSPNIQQAGLSAIAAQIGATMKANLLAQLQMLVQTLITQFLTLGGLLDFLFFEQNQSEQDIMDASNTEGIVVDFMLSFIELIGLDAFANQYRKNTQTVFTLNQRARLTSAPSLTRMCQMSSARSSSVVSYIQQRRASTDISTDIFNRSRGVGRPGGRPDAGGGGGGSGSGTGDGSGDGAGDDVLNVSEEGEIGDLVERFNNQFFLWCDPNDEGGNLEGICINDNTNPFRNQFTPQWRFTNGIWDEEYINNDINFAKAFLHPDRITLDKDNPRDLNRIAMAHFQTNMFPVVLNNLDEDTLKRAVIDGEAGDTDVLEYLLARRRFEAMRSIAQKTFGELQARREGMQPNEALLDYVAQLLGYADYDTAKSETNDFNPGDESDIQKVETAKIFNSLGEEPSMAAILEVMARMQYLSPVFFADLASTDPGFINSRVLEAGAIRSVVMKELLDSMLRTEALTSSLLELNLRDYKEKVIDQGSYLSSGN